MSPDVRLTLLGSPALFVGGEERPRATRKLLGLLAVLAAEGRAPRAKLASLLWAELNLECGTLPAQTDQHKLVAHLFEAWARQRASQCLWQDHSSEWPPRIPGNNNLCICSENGQYRS